MHEFTLTDKNGKEHLYTHTPFGMEGLDLVVKCRAMAVEPLAKVLQNLKDLSALQDDITEMLAGRDLDDINLGEVFRLALPMLEVIPWVEVAANMRDAFMAAGGHQLIRRLLMKTYRDGEPLAKDREFEKAYARNWNEMFIAAFKVAEYNDFLGFTLTSTTSPESSKGAVGVGMSSSNGQLNAPA